MPLSRIRLIAAAALVAVFVLLTGCATSSLARIDCAAVTESAHWSKKGKVLIAKTRFGCSSPATVRFQVAIERKVGDKWRNYTRKTHEKAAVPDERTVYTDTKRCTSGTYRTATRILEINGSRAISEWDRASTAIRVNC